MATIDRGQFSVMIGTGQTVVLQVPVGGRKRQIRFGALAAQECGTLMANAGFDALDSHAGFPTVREVRMRPYDASGCALVQFGLESGDGPLTLKLDAHALRALAQAAQAALEFSADGGNA